LVRYICDPVLGDEGKFYVPEDMVEIFRVKVIPRYMNYYSYLFSIENKI
jgi:pyridoxal/pyridoxine/pyridoxamine kinase